MSDSSQPAYFAHANVFHHDGKSVPIELSIATIPRDGSDPEVMCITVNYDRQTSKPKDFRSNCQENARFRLVHHLLPKSVPVEYLPFCVRDKFSQLARGNRGLMWCTKEWRNKIIFKSSDYLPSPWRRCRNSIQCRNFAMEPFPTPCMRVCTRKMTFHAAPW
ncbi:hypothetical protein TNCV_3701281 [Trichonephila clavipes]|nr:hypothetical protein TNCV_3701281 [Trichonephila clavipes]